MVAWCRHVWPNGVTRPKWVNQSKIGPMMFMSQTWQRYLAMFAWDFGFIGWAGFWFLFSRYTLICNDSRRISRGGNVGAGFILQWVGSWRMCWIGGTTSHRHISDINKCEISYFNFSPILIKYPVNTPSMPQRVIRGVGGLDGLFRLVTAC